MGAADGQVAFETNLTGTGVTSTNSAAFFLSDMSENVFKVLREGDLFDSGNGLLKQINVPNDYSTYPLEGRFNDFGQLLLTTDFSDNSAAIFIAQVVPEPGAEVLIASGAFVLVSCQWLNRRRQH